MSSVDSPLDPTSQRAPRQAFVVALALSLGVAVAMLQYTWPSDDASGPDRPAPSATDSSPTAALAPPAVESVRFDRLSTAQTVQLAAAATPTRRLGSGTRRAVRLAQEFDVPVEPVQAPVAVVASARTVPAPVPVDATPIVTAPEPRVPVHYAKLDGALRRLVDGDPAMPVRVIVRTQPGQHVSTATWLTSEGRDVHRLHSGFAALTATLSASDIGALSEDPSIARLSIDAVVAATTEAVTDGVMLRDTLGLLRDDRLDEDGPDVRVVDSSVGVAIIDSGIEPSMDLDEDRIVAFYDFTRGGVETEPHDDYGHGTHVAGLIAGTGESSEVAYQGAAHRAHLVGYKVLDAAGTGYTSDVVAAIDHVVANRDALAIDVVNLALGHPIYEPAADDPLVQAVERATAAGLLVVTSAGNDGRNPDTGQPGYGGISSPGNAPSAITVGAIDLNDTVTRADDTVTGYSSRGPTWYDAFAKPDLVAPGHRLVATMARTSTIASDRSDTMVSALSTDEGTAAYMPLSGTSMAAGVVSGVVAMMVEAHRDAREAGAPSLTPNAVKAILQYTSVELAGVDTLTQGAGALNAVGAVRLAAAIDTTSEAGTWWLTELVTPVDLIGGAAVSWAQRVVWGDRIVWGDVIFHHERAWAPQVVWGDRVVWDDRLAWGDDLVGSVVWGDRAVWGDHLVWGESMLGVEAGADVLYGDRIVWDDQIAWDDRLVWGDLSTYTQGVQALEAAEAPVGD